MHYRPRRWTCDISAALVSDDGEQDVRVRSVSSTGLGLSDVRGLAYGREVTIMAGKTAFLCRVAWIGQNRAGIEFVTPQTRKALAEAGLRSD